MAETSPFLRNEARSGGNSVEPTFPTFFDRLPVELRNHIYSRLAADIELPFAGYAFRNPPSASIVLNHYLDPNLLLVSWQFKAEYESEVLRNTEMQIIGETHTLPRLHNALFPKATFAGKTACEKIKGLALIISKAPALGDVPHGLSMPSYVLNYEKAADLVAQQRRSLV